MNSVKRYIALVLAAVICISVFSGCSNPLEKPFYTERGLMEQCGFEKVHDRDTHFAGEECLMMTRARQGDRKDYYDYMTFYIFDTVEEAERAFQETDDWFKEDDYQSGKNSRSGWLKGVCDADIYEYIHISGNLIITADIDCIGYYYEEGYETEPAATTKKLDKNDFINFVEKEFP